MTAQKTDDSKNNEKKNETETGSESSSETEETLEKDLESHYEEYAHNDTKEEVSIAGADTEPNDTGNNDTDQDDTDSADGSDRYDNTTNDTQKQNADTNERRTSADTKDTGASQKKESESRVSEDEIEEMSIENQMENRSGVLLDEENTTDADTAGETLESSTKAVALQNDEASGGSYGGILKSIIVALILIIAALYLWGQQIVTRERAQAFESRSSQSHTPQLIR
jgi:hypothetical protein